MHTLRRRLAGDRSFDAWPAPAEGPPLAPILGCWHSLDGPAGGVVRLSLRRDGDGLSLRAWGAGAPEPVDWGEVPAVAHAAGGACPGAMAFSARYDFGRLAMRLIAYARRELLVLETHCQFHDGSGRAAECGRGYFHR
jgi:hypothetical protein